MIEEIVGRHERPIIGIIGATNPLPGYDPEDAFRLGHDLRRVIDGKVKVRFGVLLGNGADVTGSSSRTSGFMSSTDWRDDSDIIGVSYDNGRLYRKKIHQGIVATPVRSKQARDYRRRMYAGVERIANKARERSVQEEPVAV